MYVEDNKLDIKLRSATSDDLHKIVDLDAQVSGLKKKDYWYEIR